MTNNKSCKNCLKGKSFILNEDILCVEKGIVTSDYICSKHRLIPPIKYINTCTYNCIDCNNFIFSNNMTTDDPTGSCQLFTVRKYNGRLRSTCSKFVKKISILPVQPI